MLALSTFNADFGLIVTFGGIGLVVNALIVYIVAVVLGERAQNRRRAEGDGDDVDDQPVDEDADAAERDEQPEGRVEGAESEHGPRV
jgi:hypothetical protein